MNRNKKIYTTPEVDIEKFTIYCDSNIVSSIDDNGIIGSENGYDNGGTGDTDWEF